MMASDLLEQLLEATPYPPEDVDADAMLAAFQQTHAARQAIIEGMQGLLIDGFDREGVKELAARQEAWQAALASSMERVRAQRIGIGKLRKYAPSAP
jgi:hypothetical protein